MLAGSTVVGTGTSSGDEAAGTDGRGHRTSRRTMTPAIRSDAGHDRCAWVGHRGPARATANTQLVPTALGRFRERHPSVATTVAEALTTELLADLRSGALDVAVVSDHPTGVLPAHGVALVHLCDDPLLVALGATTRWPAPTRSTCATWPASAGSRPGSTATTWCWRRRAPGRASVRHVHAAPTRRRGSAGGRHPLIALLGTAGA